MVDFDAMRKKLGKEKESNISSDVVMFAKEGDMIFCEILTHRPSSDGEYFICDVLNLETNEKQVLPLGAQLKNAFEVGELDVGGQFVIKYLNSERVGKGMMKNFFVERI